MSAKINSSRQIKVGGANVQHQMFLVTFGPDDRVTDYITSYGASEVDSGLAIGGKAEIADVEAGKRPK